MISFKKCLNVAMLICAVSCLVKGDEVSTDDQSEALRESLVYIEASIYSYSAYYPWRQTDLSKEVGYGCAVGPYEVLTTAYTVADATFIKVQKFGHNEMIPAKVKVVDYQSNLCLLELDRESLDKPLKPITFSEEYRSGSGVDFYWLKKNGRIYKGRGFIDRVEVRRSVVSFGRFINYVMSNVSQRSGRGQLFFRGDKAIGLGCRYSQGNKETSVIPGVVINQFLGDAVDGDYDGFPALGFVANSLIDPTLREYLKMPKEIKEGVYISDVYNLGAGSDELIAGDVILAIDGVEIDAHGKYDHPIFKRISFEHLITSRRSGDKISCEVWRDGAREQIEIEAKNFTVDDMLVPYNQYDRQSRYIVVGGLVIQQLTRKYLSAWGKGWSGRADPHLYHYYHDMAYKPDSDRRDIVILSQVLPADINLGYQSLRQLVITRYNGMTIRSIKDIPKAQNLNPESKFDIIEFENDNATVVLRRDQLAQSDAVIAERYGIEQVINLD